ncbi:hypothetical protein [Mycobacteroides abscessus]|uniref:hypothetical protein n=1 Tax=Mycobacteroides abscessus TaxID=36809 RepID=UPI001928A4B8|nr:hypothetical protein [Mycobacteroides abscessus]MBL3752688.1 hypothetical protein [Mycobacteroides abscessus subsp. massiliense]
MSTEDEVWRVLTQRTDQQADRWFKPAGLGLLAGVLGTAIAVSNHPTPTWAAVMAVVGWLVCIVSFVIPMSGAYRDGNRLEEYVRAVEDYRDDDFEDDDFEDEDGELDEQPVQAPAPSAPPTGGGSLLSSLRQQGQ